MMRPTPKNTLIPGRKEYGLDLLDKAVFFEPDGVAVVFKRLDTDAAEPQSPFADQSQP